MENQNTIVLEIEPLEIRENNMEYHIVTGSKGGVGKTLLTLLLIARNIERGIGTLVVDLNAMNADSCALLIGDRADDKKIHIQHPAATNGAEQLGADNIIVQKTFALVDNGSVDYAVGWPSNPFTLYKPTLFADFLCTMKTACEKRIKPELGLDIQSIIIDSNYHFCNIFSQQEEHYKQYQDELKNDNIAIWFLWVYRQLDNLLKPNMDSNAKALRETAGLIEHFFKHDDNPAPFMHVITPMSLVSSQLEAHGPIFILLNAIRQANDDVIVEGLDRVGDLPKGDYINFDDWRQRLNIARTSVKVNERGRGDEIFLATLRNALKDERPMNVIPLWNYHAGLHRYTDKHSLEPVAEMRNFDIYNSFIRLMG